MQELLHQLRDARLHAAAEKMEDAKQHIDEVLEHLDDAFSETLRQSRPSERPWLYCRSSVCGDEIRFAI